MKLSIRQVRYVCEVASLGSIQAASMSMHISPSSILAAIKLAEGELGAAVSYRRPSEGVRVTPAGERFIAGARALLDAQAQFSRMIGGLAQSTPQTIKIGCFEPFGALFLTELLKRYSNTFGPVNVCLFEGDQTQLRRWLDTGAVDLVITYDIGTDFGGPGSVRICHVPPHAILSTKNPLARKRLISLRDLSQHPFVLLDLPQTSTYLLTLFDVLAARPQLSLRTRSYETVRAAVGAEFGVSILNLVPFGDAQRDAPNVVRRPIGDDLPAPCLIVADIYGESKPAFVRNFIQSVKDHFVSVGPARFAATTQAKQKHLFDVNE